MLITATKSLADFDGNRQNNFTLIRIILAWLVLFGHSFAIQHVPGLRDPLSPLLQGSVWIGTLAVYGFFAISGFLVTASFVRRGLLDFSLSRILRIYPALICCVIATVFVLGPSLTTLNLSDYFSDSKTYSYFANATAYLSVQWDLPGLFQNNHRHAVNGSLWSLPVEVRCYLLLAIAGTLGVFRIKMAANIALVACLAIGWYNFGLIPLLDNVDNWSIPALYFLLGSLLYINRHHVPISGLLATIALVIAGWSLGESWYNYLFPPCFIYLLFFAAYGLPHIDADAHTGDISYGLYIYA